MTLARCLAVAGLLILFTACQHTSAPSAKPPTITAETPRSARNLIVFDRAWELVNTHFYDVHFNGVDWPAMKVKYRGKAETANDDSGLYHEINQMLRELKVSHVRARPYEIVKDQRERISPSVLGVVNIEFTNGTCMVWDVYPGSSAAAAGVRRGWIDKTDYKTIDSDALDYGDTVHCTFEDVDNNKRELDLKLTRFVFDGIYESRVLTGGFLYLRFDTFDSKSAKFLKDQLAKHRSAAGVILDLRFNQGGSATAHNDVAGCFFPKRVPLGSFINRQGGKKTAFSSHRWYKPTYQGPLAVLVGVCSASAAEVFASAVQYHRRGLIIGWPGDRTSGCMLNSLYFPLPDGGSLQIAVSNFLTNSGQSLEGIGVTSDKVVTGFSIEDVRSGMDTGVKAAVAALEQPPK